MQNLPMPMLLIGRPCAQLSEYVDMYFYGEGISDGSFGFGLPKGGIELLINLADPQFTTDDSGADGERFSNAWVSGLQTSPLHIRADGRTQLIGVRFSPHGAVALLGAAMHEMTNVSVHATDIWPGGCNLLAERIHEANSPAERFALLDQFLLERLRPLPRRYESIAGVVNALRSGRRNITALAREASLSTPHLRALFREQVGVGPKTLSRLIRFNEALIHLERISGVEGGRLAMKLGYFDQPHFIRDFADLANMSPMQFVAYRRRANHPFMNFIRTSAPVTPRTRSKAVLIAN